MNQISATQAMTYGTIKGTMTDREIVTETGGTEATRHLQRKPDRLVGLSLFDL